MALTWTLTLKDALSNAARAAARSLGGLNRALRGVRTSSNNSMPAAAGAAAKLTTQYNKMRGAATAASAAVMKLGKDGRWRYSNGKFVGFGGGGSGGGGGALGGGGRRGRRPKAWDAEKAWDGDAIAGTAGMVGAAGAAAFGGAKHIAEAQAFRGSTMRAFETILGSRKAAEEAFATAQKTSMDVGADFKESMSSMNSLLAQGFDVKAADDMIRGLADLKVINPAANMQGIVTAISQIKSTGRLQGDELMQLNEAGLATTDVYEQIGKAMKLTEKNGKSVNEQIQDLQAAGKISSDVAIAGIMAAMKKKAGGGDFGALATAGADKSLMGLLMRANNLKDQLMGAIEVDWSPFTSAVKAAMGALQSDKGAAMLAQIGTSLSSVMSNLFGSMDEGDFEATFAKITSGMKTATNFANAMIDVIQELAPVFSAVFSIAQTSMAGATVALQGLTAAIDWIASASMAKIMAIGSAFLMLPSIIVAAVSAAVVSAVTFVTEGAASLGSSIIDGMVSGINAGLSSVVNAITGVAQSALSAAEEALGIASPSKRFEEIYKQTGAGAERGVDKSAPKVAIAAGSMAATAAAAGSTVRSSITSSNADNSRSMTIGTLNVGGGGGDPRATARALTSELRSQQVAHG